jgi:hypothetical protein
VNKDAVNQARNSLDRARAAFEAMEKADSFKKLEDAWSDFLIAANRVYGKLEQGAKDNGKSSAWFGRKKHERKKDPLLSYLKQARDADEHGLQQISERKDGGFSLTAKERPFHLYKLVSIPGKGTRLTVDDPTAVEIRFIPSSISLIEVTNRGEKFPPPTQHLGKPLECTRAVGVAKHALRYLENLLTEAVALV